MNDSLISDTKEYNDGDHLFLLTDENGSIQFNYTAALYLFPYLLVHFNLNSMANILSLNNIENLPGVHITVNTLEKSHAY